MDVSKVLFILKQGALFSIIPPIFLFSSFLYAPYITYINEKIS